MFTVVLLYQTQSSFNDVVVRNNQHIFIYRLELLDQQCLIYPQIKLDV